MFVEFIHFVCFWLKRTPDGWCSSPRLKEPGMDTILQRIAKVLNVVKFPNAPSLSPPFSFPCRPYCIDRYWYPLSELKHVETATCCCGFCPRLSIAFKWWSETVTVSFSVLFDSFHLMHGTSMPFQYHRIPDQQELWARTDQWRWAKTKTWVGTLCRLRLRSCRRPQKETSFNQCPLTIVALCSN